MCLRQRGCQYRLDHLACEPMKICTVCGKQFEPTKNNIRKGFWNCRDCWNAKWKDYRARRKAEGRPIRNRPEWIEAYNRSPQRRAYNCRVQQARWRDPLERPKLQARFALNNAIRKGHIKRGNCSICGTTKDVEGHHPDYSKPLNVIWVCPSCHSSLHRGSHRDALG